MKKLPLLLFCSLITVSWIVASRAKPPPANPHNACDIFREHESWFADIRKAARRWSIPEHVILSFVHQESSFKHNAIPPMGKVLGTNTWSRKSSAKGYAQAKDETWSDYERENDRLFASRSDFGDATDFIGWYNSKSVKILKFSPTDTRNLYLAYHEGWTGYRREDWHDKPKLKAVANKVARLADTYKHQLRRCGKHLKVPWYSLLPDLL